MLELSKRGGFMAINSNIEKFLASCDEVASCKFLVAEHKIQKLLSCLASTSEVVELVADCMEQFNRDREFMRAFVKDEKGGFHCYMPEEEFKIISVVFCVLADIDAGKLDFGDFVKRFFSDDEQMSPYENFVNKMIVPFKNLICEAFSYEETEKVEEKPAEDNSSNIVRFPIYRKQVSKEGMNKVCDDVQSLTTQILTELESTRKIDNLVEELKAICYALVMACSDKDLDMMYGLVLGLKYASKGFKAIKFLVREMVDTVSELYQE